MTSLPLVRPSRTVLADALIERRALGIDLALIGAGTLVTALLAQVSIPLVPVPVTGQTLAVMLVGASLGARRGAASMALYLVLGVLGLPVFAGFSGGFASVMSPSFGYIIGFIPAAAAAGWLAERKWDRTPLLAIALFGLASLIPFAFGMPYLALILGTVLHAPNDLGTVFAAGFTPFLVGGAIKWAIAAALMPILWKAVRAIDARRGR